MAQLALEHRQPMKWVPIHGQPFSQQRGASLETPAYTAGLRSAVYKIILEEQKIIPILMNQLQADFL